MDYYSHVPEWASFLMAISMLTISIIGVVLFFKVWSAMNAIQAIKKKIVSIDKKIAKVEGMIDKDIPEHMRNQSDEIKKMCGYTVEEDGQDVPGVAIFAFVIAVIAATIASVAGASLF